jgi:hypothetical protein
MKPINNRPPHYDINRNIGALLCFVSLLIFTGTAGIADAAEKFAGEFLKLGSGARILGMGSAATAVVDDATSSYYNPSGLTGLEHREFNLMHSEQFGGLENYNSASFGTPISDRDYIGVTLLYLGIGDIKITRLRDMSNPTVSDSNRIIVDHTSSWSDYAFYLSGARRIHENIDIGASVKILRRTFSRYSAFGYGVDLGAKYRFYPTWTLGVMMRDITGTTIAWDGAEDDRIAPTAEIGLSQGADMPFFGGSYLLSGSLPFFGDTHETKSIDTMFLGAEYTMNRYLAFRAGYSESNTTFGLGIMHLPLLASTSIDYAFLSHEAFDSTHRISMAIAF